MPSDLKIGFSGVTRIWYLKIGCLIWPLAWCFALCGFCESGITGIEKRAKKKKAAAILRSCFFSDLPSACSPTHSNNRVIPPVTSSPLLLSPSLSWIPRVLASKKDLVENTFWSEITITTHPFCISAARLFYLFAKSILIWKCPLLVVSCIWQHWTLLWRHGSSVIASLYQYLSCPLFRLPISSVIWFTDSR